MGAIPRGKGCSAASAADEPAAKLMVSRRSWAYFAIMSAGSYARCRVVGLSQPRTTTLAFTAVSSHFELAIAIGLFGVTSGQALAGVVVGLLIEVPVLLALVYVSLWLRRRWTGQEPPRS